MSALDWGCIPYKIEQVGPGRLYALPAGHCQAAAKSGDSPTMPSTLTRDGANDSLPSAATTAGGSYVHTCWATASQ